MSLRKALKKLWNPFLTFSANVITTKMRPRLFAVASGFLACCWVLMTPLLVKTSPLMPVPILHLLLPPSLAKRTILILPPGRLLMRS
eukprot:9209795-Heterocapsa_arctica.AAC.1